MPLPDRSLPWYVGRYFEHRAVRLSENSLGSYGADMRLLLRCLTVVCQRALPDDDLEDVDAASHALTVEVLTVDNLAAALALVRTGAFRRRNPGTPRSDGSVRHVWACATTFCDWLVDRRLLAGNPMGGVDNASTPRAQPKALSLTAARQLLIAAADEPAGRVRIRWPARDYALIATGLLVGARVSEMTDLSAGSIHGQPGAVYLHVTGKGKHERPLPVPPLLEAALIGYLEQRVAGVPITTPGVPAKPRMRRGLPPGTPIWEQIVASEPLFVTTAGKPMDRGHLYRVIEYVYAQAGLPPEARGDGVAVHALRHTFATMLSESGVSTFELQQLLGHSSSTTTERYVRTTAGGLRLAVLGNPLAESDDVDDPATTIVADPDLREAALSLILEQPELAEAIVALTAAGASTDADWAVDVPHSLAGSGKDGQEPIT